MAEFSKLNGYEVKDETARNDIYNLNLVKIHSYDTVQDMISDTKLVVGQYVETKGYYSAGDGGKGEYIIVNDPSLTDDGGSVHEIENGLKAKLITLEVNPEMFGAYGDGTHDDHDALISIIKYANNKRATINNNHYDSRTIKFNNKVYLNGSTIIFGNDTTLANTINIDGNGAWITGYGFKFDSNAGWQLFIKNLNFSGMTTAFQFDNRNLEYGSYIFEKLIFRTVDIPFNINRMSCMVEIRNCMFKSVKSIGEFSNIDRLNFHHNWIEPSSSIENEDYKSMLKQNTGSEGSMFIYNNLFVPVGGTNCKELAWIEVNEHARIYNNRFGGENSRYHPVRIGAGFLPKGNDNSKYPYFSFDHNDDVHGNNSIILESIAGTMLIEKNQGWLSGNKILIWSDKIIEADQNTLINNQAAMLNLVIKDNVGRTFKRESNGNNVISDYLPSIPTNLYGVLNRGLYAIDRKTGENKAYLGYLEPTNSNSQTLTIYKQPFNDITTASTTFKFTSVSNFSLLLWFGYGYGTNYECKTTYALITFEMESGTTNLSLNLNYLGETLPVTVTFSNGTTTIDASTLNGVDTLNLIIATSESNKVIKNVKAQIFNPHNQLGSFV